MKIKNAIYSVICLFAVIFFMGCGNDGSNNSSNQNLSSGATLVGKKYAGQETLEGSTKCYMEVEFIDEFVCTHYYNEYDYESDKFYDYSRLIKKRWNYTRNNNEIILTKEGADGNSSIDVRKTTIAIKGNNLVFNRGGGVLVLLTPF